MFSLPEFLSQRIGIDHSFMFVCIYEFSHSQFARSLKDFDSQFLPSGMQDTCLGTLLMNSRILNTIIREPVTY